MPLDIPSGLIADIQAITRREANLSSYDPNCDLPALPSLHDSIFELDPSPDYLRCKHCRGRLLNGVSSIICVFCGTYPENRFDSVKFSSTVGYRWLLDSLNLDGSELVELPNEHEGDGAAEIRRNKKAENTISVSELLDLELKWTAPETKTPLNNEIYEGLTLGGVDSTLVQSSNNNGNDARRTKEGDADGWEADFQFVSTPEAQVIQPSDVDNITSFPTASSILSDQLDSIFGTGGKAQNSDDFLINSVSEASNSGVQRDTNLDNTSPSSDVDWFGDSQWEISIAGKDAKATDVASESLDWNNFGHSSGGIVPANDISDGSNSRPDQRLDSDGQQASGLDLFDAVSKFQGVNFGFFSEPNMEALEDGKCPPAATTSFMDSTNSLQWDFEDTSINPVDTTNENVTSKDDVEAIMSQMHDLSFMLASELSIPQQKKH